MVRLDRPGASGLSFETMEPGWHITTGPAGIFYNPTMTAEGNYRVEAEIFLFDTQGRNREAFGIILGGANLDGPDQTYHYFLIRNDGSYTVKYRDGTEASTMQAWTRSDAIVLWDGSETTAKNVLAVDVGAEAVRFLINDTEVLSYTRFQVDPTGIYGLRVNHSLNLHVGRLEITN